MNYDCLGNTQHRTGSPVIFVVANTNHSLTEEENHEGFLVCCNSMLLPQAHQVMVMECVPFPGKGGFVAVQAQIKKKVIQGSLFVDVAQSSGNGVTTIVLQTPE